MVAELNSGQSFLHCILGELIFLILPLIPLGDLGFTLLQCGLRPPNELNIELPHMATNYANPCPHLASTNHSNLLYVLGMP